jgi:DNA-binding YbaB/EbfC family protein
MDMNQNLGKLMQEAQKMQQRMQDAQKELTDLVMSGEAGNKTVVLQISGDGQLRSVTIQPTALKESPEFLADLIIAAHNDAKRKIDAASKEKIAQLTSGLSIPTDLLKDSD